MRTGVTMRNLRNARRVWAYFNGLVKELNLDEWDVRVSLCLIDRLPVPVRGP